MSELDTNPWDGDYDHEVCQGCKLEWSLCQNFITKGTDCMGRTIELVEKENKEKTTKTTSLELEVETEA